MKKLFAALAILAALTGAARAQIVWPSGGSGSGGGGSPGGSTGAIQYNAGSSTFGGITDWTTSGTSDLTGASGSTLAVGGCTIGSNVFCAAGSAFIQSVQSNSPPTLLINGSATAPYTGEFSVAQTIISTRVGTNNVEVESIAGNPHLQLFVLPGSAASPTALVAGTNIGELNFGGYDGVSANMQVGAAVTATTLNNWSGTDHSAVLNFETTPSGSTTTSAKVMRLQASGGLTLGASIASTDPGATNFNLAGNIQFVDGSSGVTTLAAGNSGASNFTATLPAATANLAYQSGAFTSGDVLQASGTVGAISDTGIATSNLPTLSGGNTFTGANTFALGAITTNVKAVNITATFNAVGTTFDAPLFENITNTASAAGSLLADLQVGGITKFSVAAAPSASNPTVLINETGAAPTTLGISTATALQITGGSSTLIVDAIAANAGVVQYRINGSAASPTNVIANQVMAVNIYGGYDGSAIGTGAAIQTKSINAWTTSDHSAFLSILLTASGSTTNTEQMRFQGSGGLSVGNANVATDGGAGVIVATNLQLTTVAQSAAAQSGTLCYNTSGAITYDASLGCLSSLEELKDIHGPITGALAEVEKMKPFWFSPINRPKGSDLAEQPGFGAHQIEGVDRRLVGYDEKGNLRGVRYMEMTAVLAAALTELKEEFYNYKTSHP
jgi:hypothetical protein